VSFSTLLRSAARARDTAVPGQQRTRCPSGVTPSSLRFWSSGPYQRQLTPFGSRLRSCGTHLEVGDQRINTSDILRLYEAERTQAC
jgi:hypothetical protein